MKIHDKDEESIIPDDEQRSWDWKWSEEVEMLEFGWLREGEKSVYRERSRRIKTEIARILFIGKS